MKKLLFVFNLVIIGLFATAGNTTQLSPTPSFRKTTTKKSAINVSETKAESDFESVSRLYSTGKIFADSIVRIGLYHKVADPSLAERYLKLAAKDGNPHATMELGVLYVFSPEFFKSNKEGIKLLEEAVKNGCQEANDYLGFYYFQQKDYDKAKKYFDANTQSHYGFANAALGSMYLEGYGVAENGTKARENYRQSAIKGYPRGMSLYANLLGTENGGSLNYPDAFFWHYIAGDLGENYSRVMLYRPMLPEEPANNEVSKDAQAALQWIEMVHSGKSLKNEPIYKDGFLPGLKECEKAAENGDDWSRYYLGSMNYNGDFLNRNYARAIYYYEPISKNAKLPKALLAVVNERLAEMYRDGKGVKKDDTKAAHYNSLAAVYGSLPSYKIIEQVSK